MTHAGLFRATNVLKHYRGFALPTGERFRDWQERLLAHPAFRATCSTEELYIDSYERYVLCVDTHTHLRTLIDMHIIGRTRAWLRMLSMLGEVCLETKEIYVYATVAGGTEVNSSHCMYIHLKRSKYWITVPSEYNGHSTYLDHVVLHKQLCWPSCTVCCTLRMSSVETTISRSTQMLNGKPF